MGCSVKSEWNAVVPKNLSKEDSLKVLKLLNVSFYTVCKVEE
jgi:hypothetical protein